MVVGQPPFGKNHRPIQFLGFGALYVLRKGERFVSERERRDVVSQPEITTGGKVA